MCQFDSYYDVNIKSLYGDIYCTATESRTVYRETESRTLWRHVLDCVGYKEGTYLRNWFTFLRFNATHICFTGKWIHIFIIMI